MEKTKEKGKGGLDKKKEECISVVTQERLDECDRNRGH